GIAWQRLLDLARGVGVGAGKRKVIVQAPAQHQLRALRQRFVDVGILSGEGNVVQQKLDLIEELVVKVHGTERQAIVQQRLLDARLDAVVLLWLEIGIGQDRKLSSEAERFFEARLLDAFGIAGAQPRGPNHVASAKQDHGAGNAR